MKFFQTALIFILPTFALAAVAAKRPAEGAPILFGYSKEVPNPAEKRDIPFILYGRHDESNERCVKPDEPCKKSKECCISGRCIKGVCTYH